MFVVSRLVLRGKRDQIEVSDALFEGWLIIFYGKKDNQRPFFDKKFSSRFLSVQSVEGNDAALNSKRFKKLFDNGDFICGAFNLALGDNDTLLLKEGRKQMNLRTILLPSALECLSINCDSNIFSGKRTEPVGKSLINGVSVNQLQEPSDGGFTGWLVTAGLWIESASQAFEHGLCTRLCPVCNGDKAICCR